MSETNENFYRIQKLPPYVFAVINEMKAKARAAQQDVVDLGMGNPDGATPQIVVDKLIEAARNPRNHRYSVSRGIQHLREEMMLVRTGTMELTVSGKPMQLGPGDVGVIGSNEIHNAKNVGATRAEYFIVNIGRDDV